MFSTLTPAWLQSIHHDGSEAFVTNQNPSLGDQVQIKLRTAIQSPLKRVFLRTAPDGEMNVSDMEKGGSESGFVLWKAAVHLTEPVFHYRFLLEADDGIWWYSAAGASAIEPLDRFDFRILTEFKLPFWLEGTVFYQIFPDRFFNGNLANDPQPNDYEYLGERPRTYNWDELPDESQNFHLTFYGGDLEGVYQKLSYLQDLGVDGIYLNPIFTSYSNHKYDVIDYETVDPHLGGEKSFLQLREALDHAGMRIILDMVPNHCGVNHPWFQTAQQDPKSLEAKFFTFLSYPDHYVSWQGVPMLPKLNYTSAELRARMFDRPNAVFRRWLKPPYRVDGYRIDVANMIARNGPVQLNLPTAAKIRQSVKASNPYAYLIGENFFDASDQLQGEHWDGVMNYAGFLFPLLNWLCGYRIHSHNTQDAIPSTYVWPTSTLEEAWRASRASIPWQVARGQFNLLGSHDTSRILTLLGGDTNLLRLAAILQFTYPGVPCIYYGDEVGMNDHLALASRGPMQWDSKGWNRDIQDFYRRLIWLRKTSPALRRGGFQMLKISENSLVFQRQSRMQRVVVCANRGPGESGTINISAVEAGIPEGSIFTEAFTGRQALVRNANLSLPTQGVGATIWFG